MATSEAEKVALRDYARAQAKVNDIEVQPFVAQIEQESGFNADAYNSGSNASGIAQIVPRWHPGVDVWNPYRSLEYAAGLNAANIRQYGTWTKALIAYNWGSGNMATNWDGTYDDLPRETQSYVDIILGHDRVMKELGSPVVGLPTGIVRIGPDVPDDVIRQTNNWSCAVRATYAALWVIGQTPGHPSLPPSYESLERNIINAGVDNPAVGLTDASGALLARFLREQYGITDAFNINPVTRERVVEELDRGNLVLIGGRQWGPEGHWALAVGHEPDGTLTLENPAGCYNLGGTNICNQLLTSWSKSSWSAVVVPVPTAVSTEPEIPQDVEIEDVRKENAELRALVEELMTLRGEAYNYDGSVRKALKSIQSQIDSVAAFLEASATKKEPV